METKEVQVYKERLEKEYLDLLSFRKGILEQVEIDKKEGELAKSEKERLMKEVADFIQEHQDDYNKFKKQKDDYVNGLKNWEEQLKIREDKLNEFDKELTLKAVKVETANSDNLSLLEAIKKNEKDLQDKAERAVEKENLAETLYRKNKKVLEKSKEDADKIKEEYEDLKIKEAILLKRKEELDLQEESLEKGRETLVRERENIDLDRVHLYSQQESLKYAYDINKKVLEDIKRLNEQ